MSDSADRKPLVRVAAVAGVGLLTCAAIRRYYQKIADTERRTRRLSSWDQRSQKKRSLSFGDNIEFDEELLGDQDHHQRGIAEGVFTCNQAAKNGTKRVAICGGSGSGLIMARELMEQKGFEVTLFESKDDVGGVYTSKAAYKGALLTTSCSIVAFGCFPSGEESFPTYWNLPKYVEYLERFAAHFDLKQFIRFKTCVRVASPLDTTDVDGNELIAVSWGPSDDKSAPGSVDVFHHLISATGITGGGDHAMAVPTWPGSPGFKGQILHSNEFRQAEDFAGKRVMVVGLGESGSDISLLLCDAGARSVCIQTRAGPGYVVPRMVLGRAADLDTNRVYHGIAWWLWPRFGWRAFKMWVEDRYLTPEDDLEVLKFMGWLNRDRDQTPKRRFGTKNESFCVAVVKRGALYKQSEISSFEEDRVIFADGSEFECDTVIYCGGYGVKFSVNFEDTDSVDMLKVKPRNLYKRVVHPDLGLRFGFVGFFRPGFGAVPPCSEMQARYLARLLAGRATLPAVDEMHVQIEDDRARDVAQYARDGGRVGALGDFATWLDDWAGLIGCRPRLAELFFTDFRLWWRVLCGQQNALQFRLHGPGRMPESRQAIMAMPLMPTPVLLVEVWVAMWCKLLSLCGFRSFDLIGM